MNRVPKPKLICNLPALLLFATTLTLMLVGISLKLIKSSSKEQPPPPDYLPGVGTPVSKPQLTQGTQQKSLISVGSSTPTVEVHMFVDLACPICKLAHQTLMNAYHQSPFQKNIRIIFRHYPLNSTCNPNVSTIPHRTACSLAAALQCASNLHLNIEEWAEKLYTLNNPNTLHRFLTPARLATTLPREIPPHKFLACLHSAEVQKAISQDSLVGKAMQMHGTPNIFVNGKYFFGTYSDVSSFLKFIEEAHHERPEWPKQ